MEISGERRLSLPREKVWAGLMDARVLQASVPGAESIQAQGGGAFTAAVVAAIGPVRARFTGTITPEEVAAPARYAMAFEGGSGAAGFAKGNAVVTLEADGNGTLLVWKASSQIGGRLAQIGARLIDATVARMSQQFFDRFEEVLVNPALLDVPSKTSGSVASATRANGPVAVGAAPAGVVQMPAWLAGLALIVGAALIAWLAAH
jgi:carbon monoxide dehydrogenase subunit G